MHALGKRLTALREARGLERSTLAQRAQVDYQYIYRLERGDRSNPSLEVLGRLARVLGVPVQELVADTAPVDGWAGEVFGLAERLDALPPAVRQDLATALTGVVAAFEEQLLALTAAQVAMVELESELDADARAEIQAFALELVQRRARERQAAAPGDDAAPAAGAPH